MAACNGKKFLFIRPMYPKGDDKQPPRRMQCLGLSQFAEEDEDHHILMQSVLCSTERRERERALYLHCCNNSK
ncbi:hypothetical protein M514_00854 [Trichuris suis]|uniref:Uncharacterized protein n=1 Tax=Trichuris suis TaxID=68888 RepID=A0A085MVE4_9BILA|nr:hypothetical protein M513_00854 [Trichuris suis]KFD61190.1 hypothetical protein M514_00854 [Trichuris suis]